MILTGFRQEDIRKLGQRAVLLEHALDNVDGDADRLARVHDVPGALVQQIEIDVLAKVRGALLSRCTNQLRPLTQSAARTDLLEVAHDVADGPHSLVKSGDDLIDNLAMPAVQIFKARGNGHFLSGPQQGALEVERRVEAQDSHASGLAKLGEEGELDPFVLAAAGDVEFEDALGLEAEPGAVTFLAVLDALVAGEEAIGAVAVLVPEDTGNAEGPRESVLYVGFV